MSLKTNLQYSLQKLPEVAWSQGRSKSNPDWGKIWSGEERIDWGWGRSLGGKKASKGVEEAGQVE